MNTQNRRTEIDRRALSLKLEESKLWILDQQNLPFNEDWVFVESPDHMIQIIKHLKVRGAPLIGVAAALSLALWNEDQNPEIEKYMEVSQSLRESRPTAVNLMNALDRMNEAKRLGQSTLEMALEIFDEDVQLCEEMAQAGLHLIPEAANVLTHCNTGGLATVGVGTALGVIKKAARRDSSLHVYVDETRPLLQGGRLTVWELCKAGVNNTLICDNMAGHLMSQGKVDLVIVGTDRIALNGDIANKIGTYSLAVLCKYHKIPFYIAGPSTTIDTKCETGAGIPIESRKSKEVQGVEGSFGTVQWAMETEVYNPAFDVTPVDLITGIVIDDKYYNQEQLMQGVLKKNYC